jgi:cathepsin L
MKHLSKKCLFITLVVTLIAVFVFIPSVQAVDDVTPGKFISVEKKREALRTELEEMKAEIKANGYSFSVGFNPAMQYSIEQLCTFKPELRQPLKYAIEPGKREDIKRTRSFDTYHVSPYITPVKDQASCGSCWAFGQCGSFESAIKKTDGVTVDLSEQYLVSCNTLGYGCNGGWWGFDMFVDPGAILESCFPYVAQDVPCSYSCGYPYIAQSWAFCEESDSVASVDSIKQAILDTGGVCVCVYVDRYFQAYTGGVMNNCKNKVNWPNHMVLIVGWDDDVNAWYVKNSWGTGWGDNGFIWMAYNCNLLGYGASYVNY